MEKLELLFSRERETKNTIRYQEELGEVAYSRYRCWHFVSRKSAWGRLRVTIEEEGVRKR